MDKFPRTHYAPAPGRLGARTATVRTRLCGPLMGFLCDFAWCGKENGTGCIRMCLLTFHLHLTFHAISHPDLGIGRAGHLTVDAREVGVVVCRRCVLRHQERVCSCSRWMYVYSEQTLITEMKTNLAPCTGLRLVLSCGYCNFI